MTKKAGAVATKKPAAKTVEVPPAPTEEFATFNLASEFTITRYTTALGIDTSIWRWLPHDPRAQKLYGTGFLKTHAPDVAEDFAAQCANASVWLDDATNSVYFDVASAPAGAVIRAATLEEKLVILDGFFWCGGSSTVAGATSGEDVHAVSSPYWDHANKQPPAGETWVSEGAFYVILAKSLDYAAAVKAEREREALEARRSHYDEKATRYKKLGWSDDDITAEFGARP